MALPAPLLLAAQDMLSCTVSLQSRGSFRFVNDRFLAEFLNCDLHAGFQRLNNLAFISPARKKCWAGASRASGKACADLGRRIEGAQLGRKIEAQRIANGEMGLFAQGNPDSTEILFEWISSVSATFILTFVLWTEIAACKLLQPGS